eukprot:CAMPEP_0170542998 /NCGR_PEP_ID=MMETSP0211-20121228/2256_1 /TAXON_ID=311385 /ORGANISM="Pseudokeronopsis sp., Strain OXSARD2" /LENGTH=166 /DNA_ID=CAMNT_0010846249 /DNA_START=429 /DNA_END=929 /DNA_ORIENTATION=+
MKSTGRDILNQQGVRMSTSSNVSHPDQFCDFFEDSDIDDEEFQEEMQRHLVEEQDGMLEMTLQGMIYLIQKSNSFNGLRKINTVFKEKRRALASKTSDKSYVNSFKRHTAQVETRFKANLQTLLALVNLTMVDYDRAFEKYSHELSDQDMESGLYEKSYIPPWLNH